MAFIKSSELKGEIVPQRGEREVSIESYRPEDEAGKSLRSIDTIECVNCLTTVVFENHTPVLEGEGVTLCPACGESLTELAE